MCPTQINILSSAPSPTANQAQSEQESSKSSSSFYFSKSKKEKNKTKLNYEEYHDELSQSINYFMTTQAQSDIWWKSICWVWWWQCKVMKVWNSEEGFPKKGFFFKKKIRFNFKEVISNHSESVQTEWRYFFCHVVYFIRENRYKYTV